MRQTVLLYFLVLGFLQLLQAQTGNKRFINFSAKDGMPEKTVYSFAQDKLGFIWIGTANGLYRYDGARFRKYQSEADNADHQIANLLQTVYYDATHHQLILGSNNALQWFDLSTYTFKAADYTDPEVIKLLRAEINNFFIDSKGNCWIGTIGGSLFKYDMPSGKVIDYYDDIITVDKGVSKPVWRIFETTDGMLWAVAGQHLVKIDPITQGIKVIGCENRYWFSDGYYDPDRNVIWLSAGFEGLVRYDLSTGQFTGTRFPYAVNGYLYNHKVTKILPRYKDQVWAVAGNLAYIDLTMNQMIFVPQSGNEFDNRVNNLTNLFSDTQQNLWFGSFNNGFGMHPWQNEQVLSVPAINAGKGSLESLQLTCMDSSSSFLLAGNPMQGFMYYNSIDHSTSYLSSSVSKLSPNSTSVHTTTSGETYVADLNELYRVHLTDRHLEPLHIKDQFGTSLSGNQDLMSDKDGHLFLSAAWKGIYKVDLKTMAAIYYSYSTIDPEIDSTSGANYIFPDFSDKDGNTWVVGSNGVYRMKRGETTFEKFGSGKAENTQASISKAFGITQDMEGQYWIATVSSGIFQLIIDSSSTRLLNYTKLNSALPSDYCTDIGIDQQGDLWIGTSDGIVRFDPATKMVKSILGKQHGFKQDDAAYGMSIFPNQKLVINGFGNIDILDLKTYRYNTYAPPPVLTGLFVVDKQINPVPITSDTSIVLAYEENYLRFEFASLNLTNSNQNTYGYRMDGVDPEWKTITTNMPVTYAGLNSGRYIFRIRAANNDGLWNEKVLSVNIRIHPPFWRSWWFLTALGAGIGGVLISLYQYRVRQVRKEEEMKASYSLHIAELEMKALRAQMNPHFIFNCLNSIQKYILKNDTYAASKYLTKFSRLIRLILDQSNQNTVLLSSELEMLRLYIEMESLRFDDQFDYQIIVDEAIQVDAIEIPAMLIQPYIENAIWHGLLHKSSRGELMVQVRRGAEQAINVMIEDNGIGRVKASELRSKQVLKKKSYGMQLTEDRIAVINKLQEINAKATIEDLYHSDGEASGTRVTIVIPYKSISNTDLS